jgi:nicotinamidase-related amidase
MGSVSNLLDFKERADAPILVLVDLQNDIPAGMQAGSHTKDFVTALEQCGMALEYARQLDLPVAFVRHISPAPSLLANRAYPAWIGNLRPRRSDMIFERAFPSCYASSEFGQMAHRSKELVLAGLFGETSCLATLVEGYGRGHVFTYLADASVSRGSDGFSSDQMHRSVVEIASVYSEVSSTQVWVDRLSRKIGTVG